MALGRLMRTLEQGQHPLRALFASAAKVIASLLLIFPGVLSDALVCLLLATLLPIRCRRRSRDGVIEGE